MRVGVVGSGGREAAIIDALRRDVRVESLYAFPGNGGIARMATCVDVAPTDIDGIVAAARKENLDFVVVTPDDPLVLGLADALRAAGIAAFGPSKAAAQIEGSKAYAKKLMEAYNIPTPAFRIFSDEEEASLYVEQCALPVVVKASGLALGKGVLICQTREEARAAVHAMMAEAAFGDSGKTIVVEQYIEGPEVSVLAFTDGKTIKPLVSSMDHKRAYDGNKGPNTGGMGCIAPNPYYTPAMAKVCMDTIFLPTLRACEKEGHPFTGCLFFGLMLTETGPQVLEYNCRFGDPETETVLPLLQSPLLDIMQACEQGTLDKVPVQNSMDASCCVVVASKGYPVHYEKGFPITLPSPEAKEELFVAGAKASAGGLVTDGGRVIDAVAQASTLKEAVEKAYALANKVTFEGATKRRDIGAAALGALKA